MEKVFEFDGILSPSCIKHLVTMFMQHILYQRGQIPVHFDALRSLHTRSRHLERSPVTTNSESGSSLSSDARLVLRRERAERKEKRTHERLQRRIDTFMTSFRQQNNMLLTALDNIGMERGVCVAIVLGTSVFAGRECYVVECPASGSFYDVHPRRITHQRSVLQLFRNLISWSALLKDPVPPTCIHVLVATNNHQHHQPLVARPQLNLVASGGGRQRRVVNLRLRHAASEEVPVSISGASVCCCRVSGGSVDADSGSCTSSVNSIDGRAVDRRVTDDISDTVLQGNRAGSKLKRVSDINGDIRSEKHRETSNMESAMMNAVDTTNTIWWQIPATLRGFRDPSATQRSF